jgi:hypothetical protein
MTALVTFDTTRITVSSTHPPGKVELFVRTKGSGEGLLLLHGYPQTGRYVLFSSPPCIILVFSLFAVAPVVFPGLHLRSPPIGMLTPDERVRWG